MSKIPFKNKQRVSIFLDPDKVLQLKRNALDTGVSLSDYLANAGTEYPYRDKELQRLESIAMSRLRQETT